MKNKHIEWFLRHSLTVISCALIIGAGITFVVWSSPQATIIGEDIITRDLTVTRDLEAKTGRTATIVVAASDSSPQSKAQADFVADGIDDQVEIQAAIDALPAGGGTVFLTEGTFTIYARNPLENIIRVPANTTLEGMGWATTIELGISAIDPSSMILLQPHAALRNLTVDGKKRIATSIDWVTVRTKGFNTIEGTRLMNSYTIFEPRGAHNRIINNHFEWPLWTTERAGDAIGTVNLGHSTIVGNTILQPVWGQGIDLQGGSKHNTVVGNTIKGGRVALNLHRGSDYNTVSGNTLLDVHSGIMIELNASENIIDANTVFGGVQSLIFIDGKTFNTIISNNVFTNFSYVGILFRNSLHLNSDISINNNLIMSTQGVGIRIEHPVERLRIINNIIRAKPGHSLWRGVTIPANAEDIYIENNHFVGIIYPVITDNGINTIIENNIGYVTENTGTATFSGTGAATTFTIAHGMTGNLIPTVVDLEAKSADAAGAKHWSADATNITITFITAPPAGTNNVVISWEAKVR